MYTDSELITLLNLDAIGCSYLEGYSLVTNNSDLRLLYNGNIVEFGGEEMERFIDSFMSDDGLVNRYINSYSVRSPIEVYEILYMCSFFGILENNLYPDEDYLFSYSNNYCNGRYLKFYLKGNKSEGEGYVYVTKSNIYMIGVNVNRKVFINTICGKLARKYCTEIFNADLVNYVFNYLKTRRHRYVSIDGCPVEVCAVVRQVKITGYGCISSDSDNNVRLLNSNAGFGAYCVLKFFSNIREKRKEEITKVPKYSDEVTLAMLTCLHEGISYQQSNDSTLQHFEIDEGNDLALYYRDTLVKHSHKALTDMYFKKVSETFSRLLLTEYSVLNISKDIYNLFQECHESGEKLNGLPVKGNILSYIMPDGSLCNGKYLKFVTDNIIVMYVTECKVYIIKGYVTTELLNELCGNIGYDFRRELFYPYYIKKMVNFFLEGSLRFDTPYGVLTFEEGECYTFYLNGVEIFRVDGEGSIENVSSGCKFKLYLILTYLDGSGFL